MTRGYFGIGIEHTKTETNVGTLWRSANIMGAQFIFTIGMRYRKQASDTTKAWRHIPLFHFLTFESFYENMPFDCRLVGIEIDAAAQHLYGYVHHERCIYLLGAEDHGLTNRALSRCHDLVVIPGDRCLNVAVAGSIVMYDRAAKESS